MDTLIERLRNIAEAPSTYPAWAIRAALEDAANVIEARLTAGDDDSSWVYDAAEHRQWGPFANDDAANAFIEGDKYLESWAVVTGDRRAAGDVGTYRPDEYK